MQKQRVVVYLEVAGSAEDARRIRDAIGCAIDDEFLNSVVEDLKIVGHGVQGVTWTVCGESFDEAAPTPYDVQSAMKDLM